MLLIDLHNTCIVKPLLNRLHQNQIYCSVLKGVLVYRGYLYKNNKSILDHMPYSDNDDLGIDGVWFRGVLMYLLFTMNTFSKPIFHIP